MLDDQLTRKYRKVQRAYILLDSPFDICIIEYKWSSTNPDWIMEKMIWNAYGDTVVRNNLREGKYLLSII